MMNTDLGLKKQIVRIFAGVLLLLSLRSVWADIPAYQARLMSNAQNQSRALDYAELAYERGHRQPGFLIQRAEMLYDQSLRDSQPQPLEKALKAFEELQIQMPFSGKILLQKTILESRMLEEKGKLDRLSWATIERQILKARELQPGSPWVAIYAAQTLLSRSAWLESSDVEKMMVWLRQAVADQPEFYLAGALRVLKNTGFKNRIQEIIPANYEAYAIALDFLRSEGLWSEWSLIFNKMLKFRDAYYQDLCSKGELYLDQGAWSKALDFFNQAFWADSSLELARVGRALCVFEIENRIEKEIDEVLKKALEEKRISKEFSEKILSLGFPVKSSYVKGLLLLTAGKDPREAIAKIEEDKGENRYRNYYRALLYTQINEREKALEILETSLEKGASNIRELLLLKDLKVLDVESALKKHRTEERSVKSWWDKEAQNNVLEEGQKTGVLLSLMPGKSVVSLAVRMKDSVNSGAGLVFRLGGISVFSQPVALSSWKIVRFEIETQGGAYWLSVERLASNQGSEAHGTVELGSLRVRPIESLSNEKVPL